MSWTMNFTNSVSHRERIQNLRSLGDAEAGMSHENKVDFMRMLADEDSDGEGDAFLRESNIEVERQEER